MAEVTILDFLLNTTWIPWFIILVWGSICLYRTRKAPVISSEFKYLKDGSILDLLNLGNIGVVISTPSKQILYYSQSFADMLGYNKEELLHKTWAEITYPEDVSTTQQAYLEFLNGLRTSYRLEKRYLKRDGSILPSSVVITSARSGAGHIDYIIAFILDNTKKHMADQLLGKALKQAEEADRAKASILSEVSHEIRTPLNVILGFCELLGMELESTRHKEYLKSIGDSGQTLLTIVNDLLDLEKIDNGRLKLMLEPLDLAEFFQRIHCSFFHKAKQRNLSLELKIGTNVPQTLMLEPARLRQILFNLVGNAIKFTHSGYVIIEVTFSETEPEKGNLQVSVLDTGIGIPQQDLDRIFEPFEQQSAYIGHQYGGTGLGLSITKKLIRLMGGKIRAVSSPGVGSTFTLELPQVVICGAKAVPDKTPPNSFTLPEAKILLAESNLANMEFLYQSLHKYPVQILEATNLEQTLAMIHHQNPDVLVLDLALAPLSPLELMEQICQSPLGKALPRVLLSTCSPSEHQEILKVYPESQILLKPFLHHELIQCLHCVLDRANGPAPVLNPQNLQELNLNQ
ncbi:MAG: PAS domain S-box protein [Candidatus Cloacimonetes bacterium]|nr:PAS domain S-box protein [Candidatus Cloacimonadota bacterium]